MLPVLLLIATLLLLGGFAMLVEYETKRGVRLQESYRSRFDALVSHLELIVTHIDLWAFVREEVRHIGKYSTHEVAHLFLQLVRATERLLTRFVRNFHANQAAVVEPRESARAFVKTLSAFKGGLKAVHPKVPEVQ